MKFDTSILDAKQETIDTSVLDNQVEDEAYARAQFEAEKPDLSLTRIVHGAYDELKKSIADTARGLNLPSVYAKPEQDMARIAKDEMVDRVFNPREIYEIRTEIEKHQAQGVDFSTAKSLAMGKVAQKRGQDAESIIKAHEKDLLPDLPTDDVIKATRAKHSKKTAWLEKIANSKALEMDPEFERSSGFIEDVARGIGSSVLPIGALWVNPAAGALVMYEQIKGAKYDALVRDGVDPERANLAASRDALAQTPLEFIGDMFVLKTALGGGRAWTKLVTDIAESAGAEGITEFAQQYPDDLATLWAMNPDLTMKEAWDSMMTMEELKKAGYAGLVGAASGGIMAGGGHGMARVLDKYVMEPQRQKNEELLNTLYGAVKKLKEGGALNQEEQDIISSMNAPQALIDRMYMQSPVDTENRDKVYDGLLKSNITKEQADATITIIDAIAHHYAEVTGQTPEAFYDTELVDYQVMKYEDFNTDEERKAAQTKTQFQEMPEDEEVDIDVNSLTKDVLNRMDKSLRSMGYDSRGSEDVRDLLEKRMLRNGKLWHPDWIKAYHKAIGGEGKAKAKKEAKAKYKNINRSRLRQLGLTQDIREAGYITPNGGLVDLSGKREGGTPGMRSYDHREAGGTLGMQEFMAEGNIRMDHNAGSVDIAFLPTTAQLRVIERMARDHNGALVIDLNDGLGEEGSDYYRKAERSFYMEYKEGTKPAKIINDIKQFYAGETPHRALFQASSGAQPLGATVFTSSGTIIAAFEGNNASTPIHEVGHLLTDLISRYDPDSFTVLSQWLGRDPVKGLDGWTTADHERMAKAFETYMMKGKAPSFRLVQVFKKFKTWLLDIYRRVTKLGVKVSPEVSRVFDKWLTTEEERALDHLADITNLMDEESPYYEELKKLKPEAILQYEEIAAQAQAMVDSKGRKKRIDALKKVKAGLRKDAEAFIAEQEFYIDLAELATIGKFSESDIRKSRNWSEDELQIFREKGVMSKSGKINPDEFVSARVYSYGREYETDNEFLDMVLAMPTRKDAIEQKHQELISEFEASLEAEGLVLDDAEAVIDEEIKILHAILGKSPVKSKILSREVKTREELEQSDIAELKRLASDLERSAREAFNEGRKEERGAQEEKIDELKEKGKEKVLDLKAKQKEKEDALKQKGKEKLDTARAKWLEKVIALKEKQRETIKRLREQNRISQEKKKIIARLKKHIGRQGMIYENRQQLQALLSRYFKVRAYMPDNSLPALSDFFAEKYDPDLQAGEVIQGMILELPDPRRDANGETIARNKKGGPMGVAWTLSDLEAIQSVANMIVGLDATERSNTTAVKQQEKNNLIDHIYASAGATPKVMETGEIKVRPMDTWYRTARDFGARLYSGLTKIEFLCNWLDGFQKIGFVWSKIFKPLADAENSELTMHQVYDAKISGIMKDIVTDGAWYKQDNALPGIKTKISRQNAFMIALNSGNEHNLNYLREGNRIPQSAIDYIWDEFLTEQEKKAVNAVWDLFDTLYPMLNDINKQIIGVPLKKVEGHYFPIKTDVKDPDRGHIAQKQQDIQSAKDLGFGPYSFAYPEHGFRKERVQGMKEYPSLLLEASVIATHLDRTIHDITHTMPIIEVYRLIKDPGVMKALKDVAGENMYLQFTPWLKSISRPMTEPLGASERIMKHLRKTTSIVGMGFKMSVAALQPLDLTSTVYELGAKATADGVAQFYSNPIEMMEEIKSKSIMMRHRQRAYDREVNDFKRRVINRGDIWDKMSDYYFSVTGALDYAVAYPTWLAAYNSASEKYKLPDGSVDEEKAVDFADSTVRRVLGAGRAKDLPNEMKGSEMKKFWTMFYTWANKFENQMMEIQRKTGIDGLTDPAKIAELMSAMVWLIAIPAYLSMFLYKRRLPEDEEWATWLLAYRLQGLPVIRDVAGFLSGYDTRMPLSGAVQSFAQAGRDFSKIYNNIKDGKETDEYKIFKDFTTATGYAVGLPTAQALITLDGALDLMEGESNNPMDLLFRAPRESKKKAVVY